MINEFKQETFNVLDTQWCPFHIINIIKKKKRI